MCSLRRPREESYLCAGMLWEKRKGEAIRVASRKGSNVSGKALSCKNAQARSNLRAANKPGGGIRGTPLRYLRIPAWRAAPFFLPGSDLCAAERPGDGRSRRVAAPGERARGWGRRAAGRADRRAVRRTTRRMSPSAASPAPNTWKRKKTRKSCWRPAGPELLLVPAPARAGLGRGRGMDSLTKGSGVAVSVLVAATASVLLLLPAHPRASSWRDATSGGITTSSAAATSSSAMPRPGGPRPATATPAPDLRAAGPRPACRAAGAARQPGPARPWAPDRPGQRTGLGAGPAWGRGAVGRDWPGPVHAVPPGRARTRRLPGGCRDSAESAQTRPGEF